jgi:hypothetical protein
MRITDNHWQSTGNQSNLRNQKFSFFPLAKLSVFHTFEVFSIFRPEKGLRKRKTHIFFTALKFSIEWCMKIKKRFFYFIFALRASYQLLVICFANAWSTSLWKPMVSMAIDYLFMFSSNNVRIEIIGLLERSIVLQERIEITVYSSATRIPCQSMDRMEYNQ